MKWNSYPIIEQIHISEIFSLFKMHYENTYEFGGETHDFWECLYVIKGTLCVSADERIYNLKSGDIIFHKPLELHKFYITSQKGADVLVFSFSATGPIVSFFKNKVFRLSAEQEGIITALVDYLDEKCEEFRSEIQNENQYNTALILFKKIPSYSQNIALHICRLMLSLADSSHIAKASNSPDSIVFRKAVEYMNDNIYTNPSVFDIARHCSVSVSGIKRIFDKFTGIGVHKYFLLLKLKRAKKMLYHGNTVSDTAEILGFSSQGYFSKTYKREFGISPSKIMETDY